MYFFSLFIITLCCCVFIAAGDDAASGNSTNITTTTGNPIVNSSTPSSNESITTTQTPSGGKGCSEFLFDLPGDTFPPSTQMNCTCTDSSPECPTFNISNADTEFVKFSIEENLTNNQSICAITLTWMINWQAIGKQREQLTVSCYSPDNSNHKDRAIYIERSDYGGSCLMDQDCWKSDQVCNATTKNCTCSSSLENSYDSAAGKCVKAASGSPSIPSTAFGFLITALAVYLATSLKWD